MMNKLTRLTALFVLLSIVALGAENIYPQVTSINGSDGKRFCSAWSINAAEHYYATAAHCIPDAEEIAYGHPLPFIGLAGVNVIFINREMDVAVIEGFRGLPAFEFSPEEPQVGDKVQVVGYPYGFSKIEGEGRIVVLHQSVNEEADKTIFLGPGVAPGSSGGAILKDGKIISIVQLSFNHGTLYGGTPWEVLVGALKPYAE